MVDLEGIGLSHQVAQLSEAIGARVEIGREIGELRSHHAKPYPSIVGLDLFKDLVEQGHGSARRFERFCRGSRVLRVGGSARQQVLGVDEAAAGVAEAFGRLLLAETVDIDTLLADTGGQAREVAVGGDQAEAVEAAAVQQIHRVDDQRDVGGVLAGRVGELLLGNDGMAGQKIRPALGTGGGKVAIDAANAGFAELGDLLEQAIRDLRRRVVGIDQDGKSGRTVFK